jgi:hypothetical protein
MSALLLGLLLDALLGVLADALADALVDVQPIVAHVGSICNPKLHIIGLSCYRRLQFERDALTEGRDCHG